MPAALWNGAISTYSLKLIASNEHFTYANSWVMINSDFSSIAHWGEQTLPQQRREDKGRDGAGTLGSWLFRGTRKKQSTQRDQEEEPGERHFCYI